MNNTLNRIVKKVLWLLILVVGFSSCSSDSKRKEYYPNGKLRSETTLKDTIPNGIAKYYYDTGELEMECRYNNGLRAGKCLNYYKDGQLRSEGEYQNDMLVGLYREFFSNGNVKTEAHMKANLQHGLTKRYYENGKIESEISYKDSIRDGNMTYYYPNGRIKMSAISDKGKTKYYKEYNDQGRVQKEYREIDTEIETDSVPIGKAYSVKVRLSGPTDDINIKAFGGESIDRTNILCKKELKVTGKNTAIYEVSKNTPGVYWWAVYFDVKPANDTTHYFYRQQKYFVVTMSK